MISRARAQKPMVQREQLLQGKLAPDCEFPFVYFQVKQKRGFSQSKKTCVPRGTYTMPKGIRARAQGPTRAKASALNRGRRGYYLPRGYFHHGVHVRGLCHFIHLHHQSPCSAFPLLHSLVPSGVSTDFTARLFQSIIVCYVGIRKVLYATVVPYIFTLLYWTRSRCHHRGTQVCAQ